jgi:hypothetical protein
MRSQRTARKPRTSNRCRAALVANTLDLVDEWRAHRRKTGDSINATMAALLDQVDFDRVRTGHLLEAVRVLLAGLPTDSLVDVSNAANVEREILVACIGDREIGVADDQLLAKMSLADRRIVWLLDGLQDNPDALRAALDLISALGRENVRGPGMNTTLRRRGKMTASSGKVLSVVHEHDSRTPCADSDCAWVGTEHEVRAFAKSSQSPTIRNPGGR